MVFAGGCWGWRGLVGVSASWVCGLVSGRGRGGRCWGRHCWWWGRRGWMLCLTGVWVLCVHAVRFLRSLAGCGVEVRVGGGCLGIRVGLWSVGIGWLLVNGACWHGVRLGVLLVVVGCAL